MEEKIQSYFFSGDTAKFGSFTLMHLDSNTILDMQLVHVHLIYILNSTMLTYKKYYFVGLGLSNFVYTQCNDVGGSYHMEKEGLKRCLDHLDSNGLAVEYIITGRHPKIQKFLRECNIVQFYDVWHFEKGDY